MTELAGKRLYLDTNIFIYALEAVEPWAEKVGVLLSSVDEGSCSAVTSELTVAECLVKPLELGRGDLVEVFLDFLQSRESFSVIPVTREILVEGARLRATSRIKLPDALHAATALRHGCDVFLTNDDRLPPIPGLPVLPVYKLA